MSQIVLMQPEHVSAVAALEKICFGGEAWSLRSVASELENPLSLWIVWQDRGEVVGYVGSQTVQGETDMMNIAVHPDARRRGIAEQLIHALCEQLAQRGSHCLNLEVRVSNAPAIGLYEKLGFQEIGRRKNYYRNPKEDALILRKEWQN